MKYGLEDQVWDDIRAVLSREPGVLKAILFGSRAIGRSKAGSDIVLCIQTRQASAEILSELEAALDDLLLPWTFDLVHAATLTDPDLLDHVQRFGITVYQGY
jgi:predicted nucleotidyltransferase